MSPTTNASDINGKTVLITGAGSGFGQMVALDLAARGVRVIATAESWPQVTALRAEAKRRGVDFEVTKLDVRLERDRALVDRWDVDVLINNAAIMEAGPIAEIPVDLLRDMFEINFFAAVALVQRVAPSMVARRSGRLIFVSSIAGLITIPFSTGYSATKHAIEALAEGLRAELAPFDIEVVTVNPGFYDTGFNDRGFDSAMQWYDPEHNFTPPEGLAAVRGMLAQQLPPQEMADMIVDAVLADRPRSRYSLPAEVRQMVEQSQAGAWD